MPDDAHSRTPIERVEREGWDEDDVHRLRISERMLGELNSEGVTTSAGTSLVGPELLVIEVVHHDE